MVALPSPLARSVNPAANMPKYINSQLNSVAFGSVEFSQSFTQAANNLRP